MESQGGLLDTVSVTQIEPVSTLARSVGSDPNLGVPTGQGPPLGGFHQALPHSGATMLIRHDQTADLGKRRNLDHDHIVDVDPPNHPAVGDRHQHGGILSLQDCKQALIGPRRLVAQFTGQNGDGPGVAQCRTTNLDSHGSLSTPL